MRREAQREKLKLAREKDGALVKWEKPALTEGPMPSGAQVARGPDDLDVKWLCHDKRTSKKKW